jgi:phosphoribosylformimino-5-aminoimidazole carboxamide ribotide isomerase
LVDLDGAKSSQIVNYKILEQISKPNWKLILVGIEIECRFEDCFESGANQITVEVLLLKTGLFSKNGRIWSW